MAPPSTNRGLKRAATQGDPVITIVTDVLDTDGSPIRTKADRFVCNHSKSDGTKCDFMALTFAPNRCGHHNSRTTADSLNRVHPELATLRRAQLGNTSPDGSGSGSTNSTSTSTSTVLPTQMATQDTGTSQPPQGL